MKRRRRPEIPMDVVMGEILTKLPAKSLMRFKCVSKDWLSLISSKYFNNRFLTVPSRLRPRLYMCLVDVNDYQNSVTLVSLAPDTTATPSSSFVVHHDLTIPHMGYPITQTLRGFMCYKFKSKARIYNPTTRQIVTLPGPNKPSNVVYAPGEGHRALAYYFGHDSVSNEYKVVCIIFECLRDFRGIKTEHQVFVLKRGGGSWRKVTPTPRDFRPHIPAIGGVCIDGVIYYLAWTGLYNCVLVSFNIRSGDFSMIQVPPGRFRTVSLIEYDGRVNMIDQTHFRDKGMLDLWVVEDVLSMKWSKKTLVLQPSQLHLINKNSIFNIKGTTQNGKVFLIPTDLISPFYVLCYDFQSNDLRKIEIKGVPDYWFSKNKSTAVTLMDQSESLEFLET